jgi:hypothetical protein
LELGGTASKYRRHLKWERSVWLASENIFIGTALFKRDLEEGFRHEEMESKSSFILMMKTSSTH